MLTNYFKFSFGTYQNFVLWQSMMTIISMYQCIDIVLTISTALNYEIDGDKLIFIYRIMIQVFFIIIFHIAMGKLKRETYFFINLITLFKYFCLTILWYETDYYLQYTNESDIKSFSCETYGIMIAFLISLESQLFKTLVLLFSLFYSLFRFPKFNDHIEIIAQIRIIFTHLVIQFFLLYHWHSTLNSNDILISKNQSPLLSQRAAAQLNTQRDVIELQNKNPIKQDIVIEESENFIAIKQQEELYDLLLVNVQSGIYIFETFQQPLKTINSFMSHIILVDDLFNNDFITLDLYDFEILGEEQYAIFPSFHRSKDINLFNIIFDPTEQFEKKEVQLFFKKMQMKTVIEHLLAFSHIKYTMTKQALDFSLKIYLRKDKLFTQVLLNSLIIHNKPQIVLYVYDLTDEPFITQLQQYLKNSDELIQTISQKIKEPLNCTLSMLELVQKEVNLDLQQKYIDPALAGCKLLVSTANDIQDYVTLHKKNKLEKSLMDIHSREFITDCLNIIKSQALFRGLNIQVNIKQNVPMFLRTDPNRVRQIILSLLIKSIQVTISGFIEISCQKSPLIADHIEIIIKVMASNVNQPILDSLEITLKHIKQQTLRNEQIIDLVATSNQFSFSIITAFYISLGIAAIPFEFNSMKSEDGTNFYFILLIKNENPGFNQQLTQKRQSALVANKSQFHQVYGQKSEFKRHQSQRLTEISRVQIQQNILKQKRESQEETMDSQLPQFGLPDVSEQQIQQKKSYSISQISEQEDSSNDSADSKDEFKDQFDGEILSSRSSFQINDKIDKIQKQQKPQQFLDSKLCVNEPKARKISVSIIQTRLSQQLSHQNSKNRDSLLTFGGRSSVYSSMRLSSVNLGPNELLDCFEKMERIKQQQFQYKCQCSKILICEQNDFDLYAISQQLNKLQIPYIYTMQRMHIVDQLKKQFTQYKTCCKGFHIIFMGVEFHNDQLSEECQKIKQTIQEYQKETKLIGLVGFQGEDSKAKIKKLPFHDYLSKPIMIDALLFILAKWVKF